MSRTGIWEGKKIRKQETVWTVLARSRIPGVLSRLCHVTLSAHLHARTARTVCRRDSAVCQVCFLRTFEISV